MKFKIWINILVSIIMLIFSGYILADSSVMSLDLLSNPNLNVAIELIRLFWGIVGVIYFLYYLYENIDELFFSPATETATTHEAQKKRSSTHKRRRKTSRKTKKSQSK